MPYWMARGWVKSWGILVHVVRAPPRDREVVTPDGHRPPVDLGQPHDVATGDEVAEVAVLVVLGRADHRARLDERPGVDHLVDPLPDRVAATAVLALDALGSAQLCG